jgi:hypothetical protein
MCHLSLKLIYLKNLSLKMEKKPSNTSSFVICQYYEMSSFESGVGRVLGDTGPQQYML